MAVSIAGSMDMTRAPIRPPTLQDLLRHTAGIPYGNTTGTALERRFAYVDSLDHDGTGREFLEMLTALPLTNDPGSEWRYGLGLDVAGLVVEHVTKQTLGEYLSQELFRPLQMKDTGFALSSDQRQRVARPFPNDPLSGSPQSVLYENLFHCGGGCAFSTAADYLRFAQMLLEGGQLGSTRILGRKTVEYMTADHLGPEVNISRLLADLLLNGYGQGLGVAVRRARGQSALMGSPGDFWWAGAYGTFFSVDPTEELVIVYMSAAPGPIRLIHRQMISTLVQQAIVN
jgi:CubicO group peptidase (beta-lactamase class C family)